MAIQDKFVSSFSELYIADRGVAKFSETYNNANAPDKQTVVRDFFTPKNSPNNEIVISNPTYLGASADKVVTFKYTLGSGNFNVYFRVKTGQSVTAVSSAVQDGPFSTLEKAFKSAKLEFISTRVPLVMEIGTLGNEANVIDVQEFGEPFKGKLRGQADGGQLDSSVFWAPGNEIHKWLQEAATNGTPTTCGIKYKETQNAADSETHLAVFNSFVSSFSLETAFDDVMKASMTQPIDGNEYFAPGA